MTHPIDTSSSFSQSPELDMAYLQQLIRRQAEQSPLYENVAIIGCGYVGSSLADFWQQRGHTVTGTTTSALRIPELEPITTRVEVLAGNDPEALQSVVREQDTVVLSVAPTGVRAADSNTYAQTYLETAKTLVKALNQSSRVKQLIYLSSCSVYGDHQGDWVDESTSLVPHDDRSRVLQATEEVLLQGTQCRTSILRLGGIYGPGRELVNMFAGLSGMTLPGKGDRFSNWIHLDDIVTGIEFARANQLQGIYNLVDDSQLTIRQLIELVCARYSLPGVFWDASQLNASRRASLRVSNQKIKDAGHCLVYPKIRF